MLILKRRRDQLIRIGPDVIVKVLRIQNGSVTLAIEAPTSVKITRETHEFDRANAQSTNPERRTDPSTT